MKVYLLYLLLINVTQNSITCNDLERKVTTTMHELPYDSFHTYIQQQV